MLPPSYSEACMELNRSLLLLSTPSPVITGSRVLFMVAKHVCLSVCLCVCGSVSLTKFGVLQHVLNLMRFSKALSQNLRCDKVTINEYKTANRLLMEKTLQFKKLCKDDSH